MEEIIVLLICADRFACKIILHFKIIAHHSFPSFSLVAINSQQQYRQSALLHASTIQHNGPVFSGETLQRGHIKPT